jgi:hypothetical protein
MSLSEPLQVTRLIAREFDRLNIRYLIGGSLASSLHGVPRATHDVDMVAEINHAHVQRLVKALSPDFYVDAEMIHDAIRHRSMFNVIHMATMFKADIFIMKADAASRREMDRREPYNIVEDDPDELFLSSAEDIIVQKLYWYELGGGVSERQWTDVVGVIQIQGGRLDSDYLEKAALELGVAEHLKRAFKAAETTSI